MESTQDRGRPHSLSIAVLETTLNKKYSSIIKKVVPMAKEAHGESLRKNTDEPYILHVLRVGVILYKLDADEYVIAGGVLHGVLEHTTWKKDYLTERLNEILAPSTVRNIFGYISAVIEYFEGKILWKERKDIYLRRQRLTSDNALLIIFADKLDILASLAADFQKRGQDMWQTLSTHDDSSRRERYEHYYGLYQLFKKRFCSKDNIYPYFKEYETHLNTLFPDFMSESKPS